jgi:bacteriorhodopsin|tara:strand:- start:3654 stop:4499 length:846 start_codon:yes stop_codon:yes gene_type:complete
MESKKCKLVETFENASQLQLYQDKIDNNLNLKFQDISYNIENTVEEGFNNNIDNTNNETDINTKLVKLTFYFAYIFLITTGTICFIEALRTSDENVRHVMNLETCISVVAGYFYGVFIKTLNEYESAGKDIPYEKINNMRYTDWFISTPIMLLVLCIVLGMENKVNVKFGLIGLVLLLNFAMLTMGYLGELGIVSKLTGLVTGFIWFFAMYGLIWKTFMSGKKTNQSKLIYGLFIVLWGFYGIAYINGTTTKVISYNILDLIAKAFVGIFFWMYFTKVVKL